MQLVIQLKHQVIHVCVCGVGLNKFLMKLPQFIYCNPELYLGYMIFLSNFSCIAQISLVYRLDEEEKAWCMVTVQVHGFEMLKIGKKKK